MTNRCVTPRLAAPGQARSHVVAPGDDVSTRHRAEFLRPLDAGEAHKITDGVFVGAAGVGVGKVLEPLDLGRHIGELLELGGGQKPVGGLDLGWNLGRHHGHVTIDKIGIKSKPTRKGATTARDFASESLPKDLAL
jgi:hypothetical protein